MEISKELLEELYVNQGLKQHEIAKKLRTSQTNISYHCIKYKLKETKKLQKKFKYRVWTEEDEDLLIEMYGMHSYKKISQRLQRSETAIIQKARKMNLGSPQQASEYINMSELGECLGRSKSTIKRWIKLKGLPHSKRIISKKEKMYRIDVQKFWKWAYENINLMKWELYTRNSLGKEPEWLDKKIKEYNSKIKYKTTEWTETEIANLELWYKQGVEIKEIAKRLNRTPTAVDIRLTRIGADRRRIITLPWKDEEIEMLLEMRGKKKMKIKDIAEELGRSERGVMRKCDRLKAELQSICV